MANIVRIFPSGTDFGGMKAAEVRGSWKTAEAGHFKGPEEAIGEGATLAVVEIQALKWSLQETEVWNHTTGL